MDGLALLCNLFADGPMTLKRLRLARIEDLSILERTEPARLASTLHCSLPQALAFAEEARKLARRLSEGRAVDVPRPPAFAPAAAASVTPPEAREGSVQELGLDPGAMLLRPGLFPGLDEALCTRLHNHRVRTVRALGECAGLSLARRTAIPYSTLLELARSARRFSHGRSEALAPAFPAPAVESRPAKAVPEAEIEAGAEFTVEPTVGLRPFLLHPRQAPSEKELTGTDEFSLPSVEPESAGPFV